MPRGRPPTQPAPKVWQPTARQYRFLTCAADEVCYGGAAAGGKSWALLVSALGDAVNNIFNNPNWKAILFRRTFPDLERTLIQLSMQLFAGKGKYDGQKYRWSFPGGGILQFAHMQTENDKYNYKSAEYNFIGFDEVTEFSETQYLYLFSRCRTTDPTLKPKIRCATNPGGIGHNWVKRRFIQEENGKNITPDYIHTYRYEMPDKTFREMTRAFIPAKIIDNPHIMDNDPSYIAKLAQLPDVERRALMDGDWNIYSGQFFSEFCDAHVCEAFQFPLGWPVWISMDWGYSTICAIGFYTQDPATEKYYLWDEIYCSKKSPDEVSETIKMKLGRRLVDLVGRYCDRRIEIQDEDTGISTKQKFAAHGLYFTHANDDRVNGWHRVRELLLRKQDGTMQFQVFVNCKRFIEVIPSCIHDIGKPEDMNKRGEVHHADQFRYFAIMRRHTERAEERGSSVQVHPRTGYPGMIDEGPSLRHQIRRLTHLEPGKNYVYGRESRRQD